MSKCKDMEKRRTTTNDEQKTTTETRTFRRGTEKISAHIFKYILMKRKFITVFYEGVYDLRQKELFCHCF